MPLEDIDQTNKRFQLRFPSDAAQLRRSLHSVGQRNPIKVIFAEDGYVIIDGHSRVEQARRLGWKDVDVLVYPMLSDREAMQLAWLSNVVRRNLSCVEKANAIVVGLKSGLTLDEVAETLAITRRTAERHVEIPQDVLTHVDGKIVTMAHAKALADVRDQLLDGALEEWVEAIRADRWSKAQLVKQLRRAGLMSGAGGRGKRFCHVNDDEVRLYPTRITIRSSTGELTEARAQLRAGLARVEAMLKSETGFGDEN